MTNTHEVQDSQTRRSRGRLTVDQQLAIAGLYAAGGASTAEIRQRFEISDPTLYRVLQKHKVPLRRRGTQLPDTHQEAPRVSVPDQSGQRQLAKGTMRVVRPSAPKARTVVSNRGVGQFRIEFRAERVFDAPDIRDALRQAQSAGAVDIVSIAREQ